MLRLVLVVALSCGLRQSAGPADTSFVDTHVGAVSLADEASGKAFVLRYGGHEFEPDLGLRVFRYVNAGKNEVLDLVMHPGGVRYEFMVFRLRRPRGAEATTATVAGLESFRSGRGVRLGLTVAELARVLGAPLRQSVSGGNGVMVYRCTSQATCPTLKQVNMPAYEGKYSFRGGILVACEWGYPYP